MSLIIHVFSIWGFNEFVNRRTRVCNSPFISLPALLEMEKFAHGKHHSGPNGSKTSQIVAIRCGRVVRNSGVQLILTLVSFDCLKLCTICGAPLLRTTSLVATSVSEELSLVLR